jgi:hypothetical protein
LACLVVFLFLLKVMGPVDLVGCASPHPANAGWGVENSGVGAPCSGVEKRGPDLPTDGHRGAECVCCVSSARDGFVAASASSLDSSRFRVVSSAISIAYFHREIFARQMSGWMSAWSSRAPPTA